MTLILEGAAGIILAFILLTLLVSIVPFAILFAVFFGVAFLLMPLDTALVVAGVGAFISSYLLGT